MPAFTEIFFLYVDGDAVVNEKLEMLAWLIVQHVEDSLLLLTAYWGQL